MRRLLPVALLLALPSAALLAQELDCGRPVDVTVSSARTNVAFQGSAGETVYIRLVATAVESGFNLLPPVVGFFGNRINPRPRTPSATGATPGDLAGGIYPGEGGYVGYEFDLPADTTYNLQLGGASSASANLHIVLTRVNRPCGSNNTLTCGRSLGGVLSTTVPGQVDAYQYPVTAGEVYSFRLQRISASGPPASGAFLFAIYAADPAQNNRPYVVNVDPTSKRLSAASPVFGRYDWTSTVSGTITVLVFELTGFGGGNYYVSATQLSGRGCGGSALTCNSVADGVLSTPLNVGIYTIDVTGGDVYQIRVARSDTSGSFTPAAEIYDSRGARVGTLSPASASGHAASTTVITFPALGTYSIIVSGPVNGSAGSYSLGTLRLNRPCDGATALTCSSVADGAISGLLRNQVYSLSAGAGDTYMVRLLRPDANSLFRPRLDIYDRTGALIQFVNTTDLARITVTAPADGTYTLVVGDSYDSAQTGSYVLSLLRLNRPCDAGTLSCGATAAGSLPRSLAASVYTYEAAAGESFSVRLLPGSGAPQPAIEVYDALGRQLGQPLSGSFAGVDVVKPAAGTYTIVATDSSRSPAASTFTLDLLRTNNPCAVSAAAGVTVNGVISASAPFAAYRIAAAAGDVVSLRSSSSTSGFASQMEFYDPDGARLDSGVYSLSRKAAVSGNYTVILGAAAPRTAGGYSFAWQLLNQPAGTAPLVCGTSTSGTLSASGQFRYYALTADPGDVLRLIFTRISDNFSPQVEVFDSAGARIAANPDVTYKSTSGGKYLVVIGPSTSNSETGAYSVAFQRPNNPCSPVSLTCGQTTLRQVAAAGQLDAFTFNATGGDQATIRLASRSGAYAPFAELYSAGSLLATSSNGLLRRVLPTSGVYALLVRDRSGLNPGSYRVGLENDTNACPFTDSEAPLVTLARPTGGEVLPGGTTFRIQWQSDDNIAVATHALALSTDGGKTFADPFATVGGNSQTYDWILPADIAPNRMAVLRITATDAAGNAQSAASDLLTLIGSGFTPNSSATYVYDGFNRLIEVSMSDGSIIKYTWDAAGNLAIITITAH